MTMWYYMTFIVNWCPKLSSIEDWIHQGEGRDIADDQTERTFNTFIRERNGWEFQCSIEYWENVYFRSEIVWWIVSFVILLFFPHLKHKFLKENRRKRIGMMFNLYLFAVFSANWFFSLWRRLNRKAGFDTLTWMFIQLICVGM